MKYGEIRIINKDANNSKMLEYIQNHQNYAGDGKDRYRNVLMVDDHGFQFNFDLTTPLDQQEIDVKKLVDTPENMPENDNDKYLTYFPAKRNEDGSIYRKEERPSQGCAIEDTTNKQQALKPKYETEQEHLDEVLNRINSTDPMDLAKDLMPSFDEFFMYQQGYGAYARKRAYEVDKFENNGHWASIHVSLGNFDESEQDQIADIVRSTFTDLNREFDRESNKHIYKYGISPMYSLEKHDATNGGEAHLQLYAYDMAYDHDNEKLSNRYSFSNSYALGIVTQEVNKRCQEAGLDVKFEDVPFRSTAKVEDHNEAQELLEQTKGQDLPENPDDLFSKEKYPDEPTDDKILSYVQESKEATRKAYFEQYEKLNEIKRNFEQLEHTESILNELQSVQKENKDLKSDLDQAHNALDDTNQELIEANQKLTHKDNRIQTLLNVSRNQKQQVNTVAYERDRYKQQKEDQKEYYEEQIQQKDNDYEALEEQSKLDLENQRKQDRQEFAQKLREYHNDYKQKLNNKDTVYQNQLSQKDTELNNKDQKYYQDVQDLYKQINTLQNDLATTQRQYLDQIEEARNARIEQQKDFNQYEDALRKANQYMEQYAAILEANDLLDQLDESQTPEQIRQEIQQAKPDHNANQQTNDENKPDNDNGRKKPKP